MTKITFTKSAEADLLDIAEYTISAFGKAKARQYNKDLTQCFHNITQHRKMGRNADDLFPGLRAFENMSHTIYYLVSKDELLIVRVLHQSMDVKPTFFST